MRITVTQLPDVIDEATWSSLIAHCAAHETDLLVLGEMCFSPWLAIRREVDPDDWSAACDDHDRWMERLPELGVATVVSSRPVLDAATPLNEGFVWTAASGYTAAHRKYYLPDEPGFWEASWYRRGPYEFETVAIGEATAGFLICTEMWFTEHARAYARSGASLILVPRATPGDTIDKWLAGGRSAAVMGGAFCLSSNRSGFSGRMPWGALGWIVDPDGAVLATTSDDHPFATVDVNLTTADEAKATYPRYVRE